MQSQRSPIGRSLLICDFELDGALHSGAVHEFSASALVVDTDVELAPGAEIELRLIQSPSLPEIWLDVEVADLLLPPKDAHLRHRSRLRILSITREYLLALGAYEQVDREDGGEQLSNRASANRGEAEWGRAVSEEPARVGSRRRRRRRRPRAAETPREVEGAAAVRPLVVVIDDGELDDVCDLLADLQIEVARTRVTDAAGLADWPLPSRLLITTPRLALSLRVPLAGDARQLVAIAIGEIGSETLRRAIQRAGFRYLVRRPVHPEVLRLLLLQILYRGPERRRSTRRPAGFRVEWSLRWRKRRDPMLELSATGCRLLTDSELAVGARIKLGIRSPERDASPLSLRGRVIRREPFHSPVQRNRSVVTLAFESLNAAHTERLQQLLARLEAGPLTLEREDPETAARRARAAARARAEEQRAEPEPSGAASEPAAEPPHEADAADASAERRRRPRARLRREVVALDAEADRVVHTLVGCDLSREGIRVEAHPLIATGDRIRIALYAASASEPLVLAAVVARDDGPRGLWLRFESADEAALARIDAQLESLAPIESLDRHAAAGDGVVLADLVEGGSLHGANPD